MHHQSPTFQRDQMNTLSSAYFSGTIGEVIPAQDFPVSNYIINDQLYDYEGNWGFCRFNSPGVYGARIGFGRGQFDGSDYGGEMTSKSSLLLHLEIMFEDGAVLWIPSGQYPAENVKFSTDEIDISLSHGDRKIFDIGGWPNMRWHFQSDDLLAEVDITVDLKQVTILPDNHLQHNLFAMWLAIGSVEGSVRYGDRKHEVSGTIFYDHPRIVLKNNDVAAFGRNLYTPIALEDGAYLVSHYTEDAEGRRVDDYSFGAYIDANGQATWLPSTELVELEFDEDGKPARWKTRWETEQQCIEFEATVKPTSILKAWGSENVPQTRQANTNIPLIFDGVATIGKGEDAISVRGGGLAEYLKYATWF
jgi:hypothetical protein